MPSNDEAERAYWLSMVADDVPVDSDSQWRAFHDGRKNMTATQRSIADARNSDELGRAHLASRSPSDIIGDAAA